MVPGRAATAGVGATAMSARSCVDPRTLPVAPNVALGRLPDMANADSLRVRRADGAVFMMISTAATSSAVVARALVRGAVFAG